MSNATINGNTGNNHDGHWTATASKSGTYEFATGKKYVDRNIDLVIPAVSGESLSGTVSNNNVHHTVTIDVDSKNTAVNIYPFKATEGTVINATTSGTVTYTTTPGFADANDKSNSSLTDNDIHTKSGTITGTVKSTVGVTGYMNAAAVAVTGSATVKPGTATTGTDNVSTGTVSTSVPSSGYYVTVNSTTSNTSITQNKSASSIGYLGDISSEISAIGTVTGGTTTSYIPITSSTTGTSSTEGDNVSTIAPDLTNNKYISVTEGYTPGRHWTISPVTKAQAISKLGTKTPAVSPSDPGSGYTPNTTAAISSGGWLKLDEGYYAATKISLATLIGDNIDDISPTTAADYMLEGHRAYDVEGNVLLGQISDQSNHFTNNAATISTQNGTVTVPHGYYSNDTIITATLPEMTLPTAANTTAGTETNKGTVSRSTSTQYIHIPAGYNSTAAKYTINATPNAGTATTVPTKVETEVSVGTTATSGYFPVTNTVGAKVTYASAGWVAASGSTGSANVQVGKIKQGIIDPSYRVSHADETDDTLALGSYIKINKGYYPDDYVYAIPSGSESLGTTAVTTELSASAITSGYSSTDALKSSTTGLSAYMTLFADASGTTGKVLSSVSDKTMYMEVYTGTYSVTAV